MEYVPVDENIRTNPKVLAVASVVKLDPDEVAKCLIWLFLEVKKSFPDGIVTTLDGDDIRLAGIFGFKQRRQISLAKKLWTAFKTVRAMRGDDTLSPLIESENGALFVHDWMEDGCGSFLAERSKKRKQARARKQKERASSQGQDRDGHADKGSKKDRDGHADVTRDKDCDKKRDKDRDVTRMSRTQSESECSNQNLTNPPNPPAGGKSADADGEGCEAKADPKPETRNPEPGPLPTPQEIIRDELQAEIKAKGGETYERKYTPEQIAQVICDEYKRVTNRCEGRDAALKHIPKRLMGKKVAGDTKGVVHPPMSFQQIWRLLQNVFIDFETLKIRDGEAGAQQYTPRVHNLFGQHFKLLEFEKLKNDRQKILEEKAGKEVGRIGGAVFNVHGKIISELARDRKLMKAPAFYRKHGLAEDVAQLCAEFRWNDFFGEGAVYDEFGFKKKLRDFLRGKLLTNAQSGGES